MFGLADEACAVCRSSKNPAVRQPTAASKWVTNLVFMFGPRGTDAGRVTGWAGTWLDPIADEMSEPRSCERIAHLLREPGVRPRSGVPAFGSGCAVACAQRVVGRPDMLTVVALRDRNATMSKLLFYLPGIIQFHAKVVVLCDVQTNSFLAVFDAKDGREIGRRPRQDVPTWGTPTVVEVAGATQILVNGNCAASFRAYESRRAERSGDTTGAGIFRCRRRWRWRSVVRLRGQSLSGCPHRSHPFRAGRAGGTGSPHPRCPTACICSYSVKSGHIDGSPRAFNSSDLDHRMDETIMATPALSQGRLLVRTRNQVVAIGSRP